MALFKYKVSDKAGKVSELLIDGETEADALTRVRQRGLTPIANLGEVDSYAASGKGSLLARNAFNSLDFTNRLVPLLKAQIPLERALGIIADGLDEGPARQTVAEIRRGLHEGKRFSALIRNQGRHFPPMYANMVEAGEETGSLAAVMGELQRFMNDSKGMKEFLITSSIYPCIILGVTGVVVTMLFTVFIPRFTKIFTDMGKKLPFLTQLLMDVSNIVVSLWPLWIALFIALCFFIRSVRKGGKAKDWWDEHCLKIPLFGPLVKAIESTRFLRTLAVLMQNHVHVLDTVRIASKVIQNRTIFASLSGVASELRGGTRLSAALKKSVYVPSTAVRMMGIGEETGNVGEMLDQVASQYEGELRSKVQRMLALFEPLVILILASVVLTVVLAMFLAILEISNFQG